MTSPLQFKRQYDSLRCDEEIVIRAVCISGNALLYSTELFRSNSSPYDNYTSIKYRKENREDRDIVLHQVKSDPQLFRYAPLFKGDAEIALLALEEPNMFLLIDEKLKKDDKFLISALKANPAIFYFITPELQENYEIAKTAVMLSAVNYRFISSKMKLIFSENQCYESLMLINNRIIYELDTCDERDIIISLVGQKYDYDFSDDMSEELVYGCVKANHKLFRDMPNKFLCIEIVEFALSQNTEYFNTLPKDFIRNNVKWIASLIKKRNDFKDTNNREAWKHREIAIELVKQDWENLTFAKQFLQDEEMIEIALSQNIEAWSRLQLDLMPIEFIYKMYKKYPTSLKFKMFSETSLVFKHTEFMTDIILQDYSQLIYVKDLTSTLLHTVMAHAVKHDKPTFRKCALRIKFTIDKTFILHAIEYGFYTLTDFAHATHLIRRSRSIITQMVKYCGIDTLDYIAQKNKACVSRTLMYDLMQIERRCAWYVAVKLRADLDFMHKKYNCAIVQLCDLSVKFN